MTKRSLLEGEVECRSSPRFTILHLVVLLVLVGFGAWMAKKQGQLTSCWGNFKGIAIAMEMYSTDWGRYPKAHEAKSKITNYLGGFYECPSAGTDSYQFQTGLGATYNTQNEREYYIVICQGSHHRAVGVPPDFPRYTTVLGELDR